MCPCLFGRQPPSDRLGWSRGRRRSRREVLAEDIAVLKQLKTVKDVTNATAQLLLSSPVIELLASPNPVNVAITLTTADWSGMTNGAKGLQKIAACRMLTIVQEHLSDATSDRIPTGEAANYFQSLEEGFSKQC